MTPFEQVEKILNKLMCIDESFGIKGDCPMCGFPTDLDKRIAIVQDTTTKICKIMENSKGEAILKAIRNCDVGDEVTILNEDKSIFCILRIMVKEHPEDEK